jgi:integrase/recombinase XerD
MNGVFKLERCPRCRHTKQLPKPGLTRSVCPRCGVETTLSEKWYIQWKLRGKKYVASVSPKKAVAEAALAKKKSEIAEGRFLDVALQIRWDEAVEQFEKWIETNVKKQSLRMYKNSLKVLNQARSENGDFYFKGKLLMEITPQDAGDFKADRIKAGRKNSTINRDLATLKRIYSLAYTEWRTNGKPWIENDHIRAVPLLSEKTSKRVRYLELEEIDKLLWACRCPLSGVATRTKYTIVLIALDTGLRKESIHTLMREEIKGGVIRKRVKRDTVVVIEMTERVRKTLEEYLNAQTVVFPWVFPAENHGRLVCNDKSLAADADIGFKTALRVAGITDFRFHDLRHTFATWFYRRTKNWKALQEILGHADIATTMNRYAHLMDEDRVEAMRQFEKGMTL